MNKMSYSSGSQGLGSGGSIARQQQQIVEDAVCRSSGSAVLPRGTTIARLTSIQELWSGYGMVYRAYLQQQLQKSVVAIEAETGVAVGGTSSLKSVVVKYVAPPPPSRSDDISHNRKTKSYMVEKAFYEIFAARLRESNAIARVPMLIASKIPSPGQVLFILEDLDSDEAGFPVRKSSLSRSDASDCMRWLASFHKTFLDSRSSFGASASLIWEQGTYWNLATRPDELRAMDDRDPLKTSAAGLAALLQGAIHKTIVHGDAKPENFCFSASGRGGVGVGGIAAVDFQYAGWGVGVIDVAYCVGEFSGLRDIEKHEPALLDEYFSALDAGLEVEEEWRRLYSVAVADFERFYAGWGGGGARRCQQRSSYLRYHIERALSMLK